jgi:hypothetical protein
LGIFSKNPSFADFVAFKKKIASAAVVNEGNDDEIERQVAMVLEEVEIDVKTRLNAPVPANRPPAMVETTDDEIATRLRQLSARPRKDGKNDP